MFPHYCANSSFRAGEIDPMNDILSEHQLVAHEAAAFVELEIASPIPLHGAEKYLQQASIPISECPLK
jgi:hypothetical protein